MVDIFLVALPLGLGALVVVGLDALDRTPFPVRGISPSYFASVALLFGLFASLVAADAWKRTNDTTLALATEVSALRAILRIGDAQQKEGMSIRNAVLTYVGEVRNQELNHNRLKNTLAPPPQGLVQLYVIGSEPRAFGGNASVNTMYLTAVESVRAARLHRLELTQNHIPPRNFAILFLLGLLTQISIGFSHGGNRLAIIYSVMLFSVAFSGAIYFIRLFDDPYSAGYSASVAELAEVR